MTIEKTRRGFLTSVLVGGSVTVPGCLSISGECKEGVYDESSVSAGGSIGFTFNLSRDDRLYIDFARKGVIGSNPTLEVRDPSNRLVFSILGQSQAQRVFTAESAGEYRVTLENRADLISGKWETRIISYKGYCGRVM